MSPIGADGLPVFESTTGAYAVKISVDGEWQVVIIDDFFPALEASKANNENRGVAVGHSYGARELWVSLLEKVDESQRTERKKNIRAPGSCLLYAPGSDGVSFAGDTEINSQMVDFVSHVGQITI